MSTGVIDFAEEGSDKVDWAAIWKQIFKRVTVVDIENFLGGYRGNFGEAVEWLKLCESIA